MKSLTRKQFVDLTWDAADLQLATEFWLRLYDCADQTRGGFSPPHCRLEIRLSGFPRHEGELLLLELERRVGASDIPHATVERHDINTIVLSSDEWLDKNAPPIDMGLPLFAGFPFEGLAAEFRFSITDIRRFTSELVIIGQLRGESLFVKALWRSGPDGLDDTQYASPDNDALVLDGLLQFREMGEVQTQLADKFFLHFAEEHFAKWVIKLTSGPPANRPRLPGLLFRVAAYGVALAPFAWMISQVVQEGEWLWLIPLILFGWIPILLMVVFGFIEYQMLFATYPVLRAGYTKTFEEWVPYKTLTPSEVASVADDPYVRKFTQELIAAGFTHFYDAAKMEGGEIGHISRSFLAADGVTYLRLSCGCSARVGEDLFHLWPATVSFEATTFFHEGGWVESSQDAGLMRIPTTPTILIRSTGEPLDPATFYREHVEAVAAFGAKKGLTPLRHERIEEHVRRKEAIDEEHLRHFREHPYSWWDHFRHYLQWPRREQRG